MLDQVIEGDTSDPRARVSMVETTYDWTIENFSSSRNDRVIISPSFTPKSDDDSKWCLKVYPKGDSKHNKGYVSLYLNLVTCEDDELQAKFRISILDADQKPIRSMVQDEPTLFRWGRGLGFGRFIPRTVLLMNRDRYFPQNRLTIRCLVLTLMAPTGIPSLDFSQPAQTRELAKVSPKKISTTTQTEEDMFEPLPPSADTYEPESSQGSEEEYIPEFPAVNSLAEKYHLLAREFSAFNQAANKLITALKESNIDQRIEIKMTINDAEVVWPISEIPEEVQYEDHSSGYSHNCDFFGALSEIESIDTEAISFSDCSENDLPETPKIAHELISIELGPAQASRLASFCATFELFCIKVPSIVDRWQLHRVYPDRPPLAKGKSTTIENSIPGKTRSLLDSLSVRARPTNEMTPEEQSLTKDLNLAKPPNFNRNGLQYCAARLQHLATMKPGYSSRKTLIAR